MKTQRQQIPQTGPESSRESGLPGGGQGRTDEVGRSGVYPMSGPLPDDPQARTHGMASWGQGERGAAGYEDHGESGIINFAQLTNPDQAQASGRPADQSGRHPGRNRAMKKREVTLPQLALIAGTRGMLGAGLGLLLADRLDDDARRAVGWTLVLVGAVTTVPLLMQVLAQPETASATRP